MIQVEQVPIVSSRLDRHEKEWDQSMLQHPAREVMASFIALAEELGKDHHDTWTRLLANYAQEQALTLQRAGFAVEAGLHRVHCFQSTGTVMTNLEELIIQVDPDGGPIGRVPILVPLQGTVIGAYVPVVVGSSQDPQDRPPLRPGTAPRHG